MTPRKRSIFSDEDLNPCLDESKLSMKCLENHDYDYDRCSPYFENYKKCKKFWGFVISKRSAAGITPTLPHKEEREKIMEKLNSGTFVFSSSST